MSGHVYDADATARLWEAVRRCDEEADKLRRLSLSKIYIVIRGPQDVEAELWPVISKELRKGADPRTPPEGINRSILVRGAGSVDCHSGSEAYEACKLALQRGADVNEQTGPLQQSLLHAAASFGHPDTVDLLIRHGAPVNLLNSEQRTPLFAQAHNGSPIMTAQNILRLLHAGADFDAQDKNGEKAVQVWDGKIHKELITAANLHTFGKELLRINSYFRGAEGPRVFRGSGQKQIALMWIDTFDAAKVAREASVPMHSVLTRYVRGSVTEKERIP